MFKWFKKKINQVETTSNVNGIGIARVDQIKHIQEAAKQLSIQIEELNNRINNLPAIPDMSSYASKTEPNEFRNVNTFKNQNIPIKLVRNNENKVQWTDESNGQKLTIGRTSDYNNQIETFDNDLHIKTPANKNVIVDQGGLSVSNGMTNLRDVSITGNVTGNTGQFDKLLVTNTITENNQVATKSYVDRSRPDMSNVVTLDSRQVIEGAKSFTSDIQANKIFARNAEVLEETQLVNKRDVEGIVRYSLVAVNLSYEGRVSLTKTDIVHANSSYWKYTFNQTTNMMNVNLDAGKYIVKVFISRLKVVNGSWTECNSLSVDNFVLLSNNVTQISIPIGDLVNTIFLYPHDLRPGSAGVFTTQAMCSVYVYKQL